MEQLVGSSVQVVLSLKEGKGFDKVANPTSIIATLNGLSLETDLISPEGNPVYATDLVWEATKTTLRKMRSGQEPLKLECIEFKENGVKEKIGYLLLSLRSAQIVPRGNESTIKTDWHRLLGLRNDVKGDKPEFSLSLTIEDMDTREVGCSEKKDEESHKLIEENDLPMPYVIPEERLIQLGPIRTNRELFLLNILAGTTANLHLISPKPASPNSSTKVLTFWYKILDNELQSKPFTIDSNVFPLNEKIVMRIRSSFSVLKNYVEQKPSFLVVLKCGESILGESEVDLKTLLSGGSSGQWVDTCGGREVLLNERCFLKTLDRRDETVDAEEKPYLDLQLVLTCVGNQGDGVHVNSLPNNSCSTNKNLETMMQKLSVTTDHQNPLNDSPKYLRSGHETDCTSKMNHFSNFEIPQERPGNKITHSCSEKDCTKSVEAYHCYCLHVTLNTVTLQSESIKNIEFRFHHPKAEVMSTLYPRMPVRMGETLRLQDIGCKFHFISSVEEIKHLLVAYPPRISIRDEEKIEKSCLGQAILDVKRILSDSKLKCQYEAVLFDSSRHEIGYVQVQMHLEDHGPYYRTTKSSWSENLGPPVLDDSLASKIVDELETWKERQQEMFKVELQRKEERHLNLLSDEWQRRRESLESQLACSVEQCKILASNLNKATDDLRTRRIQSMEKEAQLMKANEELKWTCDRKLRDLNDASERMREDYTSKLSRLEEEKKTFEEQISELRHENNRLQKIVSKQNEELMKYQKGSLTSEQTENLLQQMQSLEDKFESTMKSKTFFKEQWGKAVREIHKLKMEHQQALEVQIKSSREELKNIDLEQLLQADSAALSNDKLLLDEIQREINVIKPKPSYTINPEEFNSLYECSSRSNMDYGRRQHSKESSQQEERLRKLIEERDTLLKTGSYSTDDAIIIRLNSEIRSLLVSR
ncbi:centrosomal protein of 120 kDa isoform X2 [Diachasma alloeum]|uniref:centrosomal protein of 120 kDa isoform X2 n=1 Tax=Diachasma alloeum TaxID=454923 RepID=UPI000738146E|nr:centrosomal protein of 120 kDa isoform X2 [Diachasma alloeum]